MSWFTERTTPRTALVLFMIAALGVGYFQAIYATNMMKMMFFVCLWIFLLFTTLLLPTMKWEVAA